MQSANHRWLWGTRVWGWLGALVLSVTMTAPAHAIAPQVRDDGKFFSPAAIQQANDQIRQIKDQFDKDLVIETYPAPPSGFTPPADTAAKNAFFADLLKQRAKELSVDGILVMVWRNPSHIQIDAGRETRQRDFTPANDQQLNTILRQAFSSKDFDSGLANGIAYVKSTLQANGAGQHRTAMTPGPAAAQPSNPSYPVSRAPAASGSHVWLWIIVIFIVVIVIIRIFSRLAGGGQGYSGGGGYPGGGQANFGGGGGYGPGYGGGYGGGGGGGGGFFRGMLGGVLGGAAGSWLYDRFNRPSGSSGEYGGGAGNVGGATQGGSYSEPPARDQGQGFDQSVGSDFGSSSSDNSSSASSGSDFDSGSGGGGSFDSGSGGSFDSGGSSDSGGGGGDSGSSGGDF